MTNHGYLSSEIFDNHVLLARLGRELPIACRARLLYAALPLRVNVASLKAQGSEKKAALALFQTAEPVAGRHRPLLISICGLQLPERQVLQPGADRQVHCLGPPQASVLL